MGYRSDLVFVVDREQANEDRLLTKKFPSWFARHTPQIYPSDEDFKATLDRIAKAKEAGPVPQFSYFYTPQAEIYLLESRKWYPGYWDVDALEEYMTYLDDLSEEEKYGFVRIGEEPQDVEIRGCPDIWDIYTSTFFDAPIVLEEISR